MVPPGGGGTTLLRNPGDKLEVASVNDVEVCVVKLPKTYPNSLEHSDQGSELVLLTVLSFLGKNLYKYIYCIPSSLLKPKISPLGQLFFFSLRNLLPRLPGLH